MAPAIVDCEICREIPDSLDVSLGESQGRGDAFPPAARQLLPLGEHFRRCPDCGAYYRAFFTPGAYNIEDREFLYRLDEEELRLLKPLLEAKGRDALTEALCGAFAFTRPELLGEVREAFQWKLDEEGIALAELAPAFIRLLSGSHAEGRNFACWNLVAIARGGGDISQAVGGLARLLTDERVKIRFNAAEALGEAAGQGADISVAIPSLVGMLCAEEDLQFARYMHSSPAASALAAAGQGGAGAREVLEGLGAAGVDPEAPGVRKLVEQCEKASKRR